jgi:hypothetical protein
VRLCGGFTARAVVPCGITGVFYYPDWETAPPPLVLDTFSKTNQKMTELDRLQMDSRIAQLEKIKPLYHNALTSWLGTMPFYF